MVNPYQPASDLFPSDEGKVPIFGLRAQIAILFVSIGIVAVYYCVQLQRIPGGRPVPLWPSLTIPFVLSLISGFRSQSRFIPALTAFLGVMTGSVAFGIYRSWPAAELPIAFAIGIVISIPSLILSMRSRAKYSLTH